MESHRDTRWLPRQLIVLASLRRILYGVFASICLLAIIWFMIYTMFRSEFWDFNVFYSSARTALQGQNIYRVYGQYNLPYWYFPWVAWLFIPFAVFSFETAKTLYVGLTFLSVFYLIFIAGPRLGVRLRLFARVFIAAMSLLACWLLFRVGQSDFLLVVVVMEMVFLIDAGKTTLAGALFPLVLFKPHLLLVFIPFALLRGGKKFVIAALLSILALSLLAFVLMPTWPLDMLRMLRESGGRTDNTWGFITLPSLLGGRENWSGTGNVPLTLCVVAIGMFAAWRNRHLPTIPFLTFTLAASLLCAPRAYSYNLPFLLPALLWLSPSSVTRTTLLWLGVGVIALSTNFSTGSYLIVLLTVVLAVWKAQRLKPSLEPGTQV